MNDERKEGIGGEGNKRHSAFFLCLSHYLLRPQTLRFVSLSSSSDPLSCQASENFMSRGHTRDAAGMGTYGKVIL